MKLSNAILSCVLGAAFGTTCADTYSVVFVWPSTPRGPAYSRHHFNKVSRDQTSYSTGWFTDAAMPTFTVTPIYNLTILPEPPHAAIGEKLYVTLNVEVSISGPVGASGALKLKTQGKAKGSAIGTGGVQSLGGNAARLSGPTEHYVAVGRSVIETTAEEVSGGRIRTHVALGLGTLTLANGARGEYRITIVGVGTRPPTGTGLTP